MSLQLLIDEEKKKRGLTPSKIAGDKVKEDIKKEKSSLELLVEEARNRKSEPVVEQAGPIQEEIKEEKKPNMWDKIKGGVGKIVDSFSVKKKIGEELKSKKDTGTGVDLAKIGVPEVVKKEPNLFDYQINHIKIADGSANLSEKGKETLKKLEDRSKSTETKNWTDRVYELATTGKDIPFVGDLVEIPETVELLKAAERLKNNKATQEDAVLLNDWLQQQNRDTTFGYKVLDTIIGSAKMGAEIYATAGIYTSGKEATKKGIKYLMSKAGKEAVEDLVKKKGVKALTSKVAYGLAGEAVRSAVLAPIKITDDILERQLSSKLEVISGIKEKEENLGMTITKSYLDSFTEYASERGGDAISILSDPIKTKLMKYSLFQLLNKLNPGKESMITKVISQAGYDGVLNEMLEERMGEVFRGVLNKVGLSDQEFALPTMEQLAVEAVSFTIPGIVSKASTYVKTSLDDVTINTVQLTPDAAIETVQMSDLRGTDAGNTIIAAAYKAKEEGRMVLIDIDNKNGETILTPNQNEIKLSLSEEKVIEEAPIDTQTSPEGLKQTKLTESEKILFDNTDESGVINLKDEIELFKGTDISGELEVTDYDDNGVAYYLTPNKENAGNYGKITDSYKLKDVKIINRDTEAGKAIYDSVRSKYNLEPSETEIKTIAKKVSNDLQKLGYDGWYWTKPGDPGSEVAIFNKDKLVNVVSDTKSIKTTDQTESKLTSEQTKKNNTLSDVRVTKVGDKYQIVYKDVGDGRTGLINEYKLDTFDEAFEKAKIHNKHKVYLRETMDKLDDKGTDTKTGGVETQPNIKVEGDKKLDTEPKPLEKKKEVPPIKKSTSEKVKTAKNLKEVKSALKSVRKKISELADEAQAMTEMAKEQRAGLNTKNIAKLKRIYARSQKFQEGDIETIRNSKHQELVNSVIEDIQNNRYGLSEQEAFNYALNLPTKAEEKIIKSDDLKKLLNRQKILNGYLAKLEAKANELTGKESIERGNELYEEWKLAIDSQEKLNKIITAQERIEAYQKPVEDTMGEEKLSKVAQRVFDKLLDVKESDITYKPMNIAQDAARATEFVEQNPEIAQRIAKGLELPPPDITETAISIAMAEKARQDGDYLLYTQLIMSRTFRQTRRGQEIVAERGRMDENSNEFFIRKLLEARAEIVTRGKKWIFEKEIKIQNIINKEVKQLKNTIEKKVLNKLESAQKIIDSLTCK